MMMAIDASSPANAIAGTDSNGKFLQWLDTMEFSLLEILILTTILRYNRCSQLNEGNQYFMAHLLIHGK